MVGGCCFVQIYSSSSVVRVMVRSTSGYGSWFKLFWFGFLLTSLGSGKQHVYSGQFLLSVKTGQRAVSVHTIHIWFRVNLVNAISGSDSSQNGSES
ncbi:hypothetical protein Hanom_Chr00s044141g01775791 [Helianthus anomalus]